MSDEYGIRLRLSAQRALLGAVSPAVTAIRVDMRDGRLTFAAFADRTLDEDEREALEMAATEIIADLPEAVALDVEIAEPVVEATAGPGYWVYLRRGARVAVT